MQIKIKFIRNLNTGTKSKKEYIFKIKKEKIKELNLKIGMQGWMENQFVELNCCNKAKCWHSVEKKGKVFSPFVITDIGYFDDKKRRKLIITKIGNTLE